MITRITRKAVNREADFLNGNVQLLLKQLGKKYALIGYEHWNNRWHLTYDNDKIGHSLTTSEFESMLFGMNQLIEKIRSEQQV